MYVTFVIPWHESARTVTFLSLLAAFIADMTYVNMQFQVAT